MTGLALAAHTTPTFISREDTYRSKKETLDGGDLQGNHYINKNGNLVYNPAKFGISAIYTGGAIGVPYNVNQLGMTLWNETDPNTIIKYDGAIAHQDHLANFIGIYSRHNIATPVLFRDPENRTAGNSENGSAQSGVLWENSIYLRANKNKEPTLMSVYLRTKEWMNRMLLQNRNDGRIFSDQYGYEGFAKDITYTVTYNPQLWTSNIWIYEPRIAPNAGRSGHIADYRSDPQHQTQYTIKYDQGKFFTFDENFGRKQELNASNLAGTATSTDVEWLKGRLDLDPLKYRNRNTPLGDVINSSIKYAAKDHFYINLDLVGDRELYANYMRKKSDNFQQNLLIAGSNDGFLNFIIAARHSKNEKGESEVGQRKASYFVSFLRRT